MIETFKITYDDSVDSSAYSAIYAANKLLINHGFQLDIDDDGEHHDGYIICNVTIKRTINNE